MSHNVESEISKIDDFLKQLGGGGGQESSKGTVSSVLCVESTSLPQQRQP